MNLSQNYSGYRILNMDILTRLDSIDASLLENEVIFEKSFCSKLTYLLSN